MSWLLGRRSQLSLSNKILLYKCVLKPLWTYGFQLWGCAKPSHTQILQRFQSILLCTIDNAPWYVSNLPLHTDLGISFVKADIRKSSLFFRHRLAGHPNALVAALSIPPPPMSPEVSIVDGQLIYTPWPATNSYLLPQGPRRSIDGWLPNTPPPRRLFPHICLLLLGSRFKLVVPYNKQKCNLITAYKKIRLFLCRFPRNSQVINWITCIWTINLVIAYINKFTATSQV